MNIHPTLFAAMAEQHRTELLRQAERRRRAADLPRRHVATRLLAALRRRAQENNLTRTGAGERTRVRQAPEGLDDGRAVRRTGKAAT